MLKPPSTKSKSKYNMETAGLTHVCLQSFDAVQKVVCFPMIQQPLLQLVSLAQQTLDLWLHSVHVRDERAVVMGLAVQIHLQGTFAFLNLEVA